MPPREGSDVGCNKMPAARGNGMQLDHYFRIPDFTKRSSSSRAKRGTLVHHSNVRHSEVHLLPASSSEHARLHSLFASRASQRFQFVLIDLDLARLLHLSA